MTHVERVIRNNVSLVLPVPKKYVITVKGIKRVLSIASINYGFNLDSVSWVH